MRSCSWVFRPRRINIYNFENSDTRNIAVIVVMPVNCQEKFEHRLKSATVYQTFRINFNSHSDFHVPLLIMFTMTQSETDHICLIRKYKTKNKLFFFYFKCDLFYKSRQKSSSTRKSSGQTYIVFIFVIKGKTVLPVLPKHCVTIVNFTI